MAPISDLITQHPQLVSKLRRFSFPHAGQLIGALGLVPELLANTIRIELLAHIAAASCRGNDTPDSQNLAEWIGKLMANSPSVRLEDPVEDVFVGCVNTKAGSFRIFQGNFLDGAFLVERLFSFYASKASAPTFQDTVDRVLALLRLSDALAQRSGLLRYSAGEGKPGSRVQIPRWRDLEPKVNSVLFTNDDLHTLGIDRLLLEEYFFSDTHRTTLINERMWNSSLERRPLLALENEVLVLAPSTLCRTAVRYMVERMGIVRAGEFFYQQENATTFVNDVGSHLRINFINFKGPTPEEGTPLMFPAFGSFDFGKPAILLTYTPPLKGAADDFSGCDEFSDEDQSKFQHYVQSCATELERIPGFSGE